MAMKNRTINERATDRLIAQVLKELNPSLFEACQQAITPILTDFNLVPLICSRIASAEGETTCENIHFVIAVLDRFYVPAQMIAKDLIKKPVGLRDAYSDALGYVNPENINCWADIMRAHYKNPRFAEKVDKYAYSIYVNLKEEGYILEHTYSDFADINLSIDLKDKGKHIKAVYELIDRKSRYVSGADASLLY
jgi:hypothetical protein